MEAKPVRTVLVAGGGVVAWSAAAAVKRSLPWLEVTVLATEPSPGALADHWPAALPGVRAFHAALGIGEDDAIARTGGSYRLGTMLQGWTGAGSAYVHAYGEHGRPLGGGSAFHNHWLRAEVLGKAPDWEALSPGAALARAGRVALPRVEPGSPLASAEYGLVLDIGRYRGMLRALARHLGVVEQLGAIGGVELDPVNGFVRAVAVTDGTRLTADLFVDATGPEAHLRGRLDDDWIDWREWQPCDRLLLATTPPVSAPALLDCAEAVATGWRWRCEGATATTVALAYASSNMTDDQATDLIAPALAEAVDIAGATPITTGVRSRPWLRNCVAIGEAAVAVGPLESCPLHLAHTAIERLVMMIPDRDCAPAEVTDYNRQAVPEAERVRDFIALHYLASARLEPFWRRAATMVPPPSLAHTLTQFRSRGRLPFYEEETFARASWLAVLLGQGVRPERIDPLVEAVPAAASIEAMNQMASGIAAAVRTAPPHAAYLASMTKRTGR